MLQVRSSVSLERPSKVGDWRLQGGGTGRGSHEMKWGSRCVGHVGGRGVYPSIPSGAGCAATTPSSRTTLTHAPQTRLQRRAAPSAAHFEGRGALVQPGKHALAVGIGGPLRDLGQGEGRRAWRSDGRLQGMLWHVGLRRNGGMADVHADAPHYLAA